MTYKYETQYNSGNFTPASQASAVFGQPRVVKGETIHHWGAPNTGLTYEGVISWLCRAGGNTSAHYVVDGPTRRVACIVDPNNVAWHAGNATGNATTIGIEVNPDESDASYDVAAELVADLRDPNAYGDGLLYAHRMWFNTDCPGTFDINRIDQASYQKVTGTNWGDVHDKAQPAPAPQPAPKPVPAPTPAPADPEWVRNLQDITDVKLSVLPADGTPVYDLNTLQPIANSTIPRGTQVDITKKTTVGGKSFYISSWAAAAAKPNGIPAANLGVPVTPPPVEKPEWLRNLQDIADKDMWTRSAAPVLNLADGTTSRTLPINTQVHVIEATTVLGQNLLVLDGEKECIETVYLSDTPISNPDTDLGQQQNALKLLIQAIVSIINSLLSRVLNRK